MKSLNVDSIPAELWTQVELVRLQSGVAIRRQCIDAIPAEPHFETTRRLDLLGGAEVAQ